MRIRTPFFVVLGLLLGVATSQRPHAAPSSTKPFRMNSQAIHKAYTESEWEYLKTNLEGVLRTKGDANVPREDRIVAYKYLGVICAADSGSRPKAISYFNRLLDLSPAIELVDLFPSERVIEVFNSVKREKASQAEYVKNHDQFGNLIHKDKSKKEETLPMPKPVVSRSDTKSSSWLWWTAGSAIAVGAAVSAFVLIQSEPETKTTTSKRQINGETPVNP